MLSFKECWNIADKYVLEIADAWENDEAYFFDDIRGEWGENYGIVVYKEYGDTVSLYEYFDRKKRRDVMDLFRLYR